MKSRHRRGQCSDRLVPHWGKPSNAPSSTAWTPTMLTTRIRPGRRDPGKARSSAGPNATIIAIAATANLRPGYNHGLPPGVASPASLQLRGLAECDGPRVARELNSIRNPQSHAGCAHQAGLLAPKPLSLYDIAPDCRLRAAVFLLILLSALIRSPFPSIAGQNLLPATQAYSAKGCEASVY